LLNNLMTPARPLTPLLWLHPSATTRSSPAPNAEQLDALIAVLRAM
jgi:hypothetical protein